MKNITLLQAQNWELITIHPTTLSLSVAIVMLEKGGKVASCIEEWTERTRKFKWLLYTLKDETLLFFPFFD